MFKRILVAFDGSSHAKRALVEAADLASATDGELTVISVVPELSSWILAGPVPPPANLTELQDQVADSYRQDLREAVEALPDRLRVSSKLLRGHAAAEILDQAKAGNHDLLIVGSRGRSEVQSLLLGSVSEHVSRASRVPVLIVHGV